MEFYILIAILSILYWGFSQIWKAKSSSDSGRSGEVRKDPCQQIEASKESEDGNIREKREKQENRKKEDFTINVEVEVQPVRLASAKPASSPLPKSKHKLTEWQKAWIMKEIVDQPRALRPYRFRQPR